MLSLNKISVMFAMEQLLLGAEKGCVKKKNHLGLVFPVGKSIEMQS